jgi:DNA-binding NtrC family response regulator
MDNTIRILVVDDDPSMAKTLADIFKVKGYEAEAVCSGPEALARVEKVRFNCVLSDIKMPNVDGLELFKAIKAKQSDLPVVLMTAYSTDKQVKKVLEEGAVACLTKPLDINALLNFFSSLRKECSVVIVDDDPQFCKTMGDILRSRGFAVTQITNPPEGMDIIGEDGQIVLLDMKLNSVNGLEILQGIRKRHPHLPVILVTGYREEMASAVEAALKINAYTCLYKPLQIEELLRVLAEVRRWELGKILERG